MSPYKNILVTGGAGFVGSNLALHLQEAFPETRIVALDNLKRRGSELNLPRLREAGVVFAHGDIRSPDDLASVGEVDLLIECSAEPSVLAGVDENPSYVTQTNLVGTLNCLELARQQDADFVFLSTSRVYPVASLRELAVEEADTRFELADQQPVRGASQSGINEHFPLQGSRTLYGATKLSSELMVEEYHATYNLRTLVNRCGVIAGPWQMGKVDQGVFSLWLLAHHFGRPLKYIGYGGSGKQVRDLLHVDDLFEALRTQLDQIETLQGSTFNVGGGRDGSLSLLETTLLCESVTGRTTDITPEPTARTGDIPVYLSDYAALHDATGWAPQHSPEDILRDTYDWIQEHDDSLRRVLDL